jgi:hypothetical protein
MNFLYPGFLFSLLAVSIPILIHLFNFRKFKVVYFSNVQFLKAAKEQHSSKEKLKDLLILISRVLAIVFLVFAFARPYFSSGTGTSPDTDNAVNIYIDNSYSMEMLNKEGTLLDEAKRKAKEIARGFSPNDRFQLTTNDFEGKHQRLVNYEELSSLIDQVKISPVQRTLQQVVNRQSRINTGEKNSFTYLLSDFQQHFSGKSPVTADKNTRVSLIRLNATALPNIAIDSIWSLSPAHKPDDEEKFVVQLRNYSGENSPKVAVRLTVNNQQKALAAVDIPAGKAVNDTLSFSGLSAGWQKGGVTIKDFPVTFDDTLNFAFKVNAGLNVLHISGDPAEKHIRSLFSADRYFNYTMMPESNISYAAFAAYPLIVVSGLKTPSSGLAQQLKNYAAGGGTVVVFPDLDGNQQEYSSFLNGLSLPGIQGLSKDTVNVSTIDLNSNLFNDVFEHVPAKLDLPKVNRRFIYLQNNRNTREDILGLPLDQLFFARYTTGTGQLYLSATSLNTKDSNFPEHPVFVPLLYKIAFSSVQEQPLYYTLGKNTLLQLAQLNLNANQPLKLTSAALEAIPEVRQTPGKTLLYVADQIKTPGFYQLKKADSLVTIYAFNDNRAESDMHYAANGALEKLFGRQKVNVNSSGASIQADGAENNHTELWKLCLVLCAVFLAVEVVLIRFFNKTKNIQTT